MTKFSRSSRARKSAHLALTGGLIVGSLLLAGCSSSSTAGSTASPTGGSAPVSNGAAQVKVTLSGSDCALDYSTAPAGPVTFEVTNTDAAGLSEVELLSDKRIIGERENIVAGLQPANFTVTLTGGTYTLNCPGASTENTSFTVVGAAATTASDTQSLLASGTAGYGAYVEDQSQALVTAMRIGLLSSVQRREN